MIAILHGGPGGPESRTAYDLSLGRGGPPPVITVGGGRGKGAGVRTNRRPKKVDGVPFSRYAARFDKKTELYAVVDDTTGDILAYIPNGKTRFAGPAKGECADCLKGNRATARTISKLLNAGHREKVGIKFSCGGFFVAPHGRA